VIEPTSELFSLFSLSFWKNLEAHSVFHYFLTDSHTKQLDDLVKTVSFPILPKQWKTVKNSEDRHFCGLNHFCHNEPWTRACGRVWRNALRKMRHGRPAKLQNWFGCSTVGRPTGRERQRRQRGVALLLASNVVVHSVVGCKCMIRCYAFTII